MKGKHHPLKTLTRCEWTDPAQPLQDQDEDFRGICFVTSFCLEMLSILPLIGKLGDWQAQGIIRQFSLAHQGLWKYLLIH